MELFGLIPEEETVSVQAWMEEIHLRIHLKAHQQSETYGFDFYQDIPCRLSSRYHWEYCLGSCKYERRSSVARSSYSTLAPENTGEAIPHIFENDVHLVVGTRA